MKATGTINTATVVTTNTTTKAAVSRGSVKGERGIAVEVAKPTATIDTSSKPGGVAGAQAALASLNFGSEQRKEAMTKGTPGANQPAAENQDPSRPKWMPKGAIASPFAQAKFDVTQFKSPFRRDAKNIIDPTHNSSHAADQDKTDQQMEHINKAEQHRAGRVKRDRGPKDFKQFPMTERKELLRLLQDMNILVGSGTEMSVTVSDLDKVLSEARRFDDAKLAVQYFNSRGRNFPDFDKLIDAVENALDECDVETGRLARVLPDWNADQIDQLMRQGGAAANTTRYVQQFVQCPLKVTNIDKISAAVKAASEKMQGEGKQALIQVLASNSLTLFTGPVQLRQSDVTKLITVGGGYAALVISDLRCLDGLGKRYTQFSELEPAVAGDADLVSFKQKLLTSLFTLRNKLFSRVCINEVPMAAETVNLLLAEGRGGLDTPEILHIVANKPEAPFGSLQEVCDHCQSFADQRNSEIDQQIGKVFDYLSRAGGVLFSVELEATNAHIKGLVLTIFNAHFSITGGECVSILEDIVAQRLKFKSFETLQYEIVDQAEKGEVLPPPSGMPEEESGFTWNAPRDWVAPPTLLAAEDIPPPTVKSPKGRDRDDSDASPSNFHGVYEEEDDLPPPPKAVVRGPRRDSFEDDDLPPPP